MSVEVPDASAFAAAFFGEAGGNQIFERFRGSLLYAPPLLRTEMANVAWKKTRREPNRHEEIRAGLETALATEVHYLEPDLPDVLDMALSFGISVYDASYLWVAQQAGATLVSYDERLRAAARAARIPVAPRGR